jgi:hypothetical protein
MLRGGRTSGREGAMDLKAALLRDRLTLYVKLRGGYTFPLAGAIWWTAMAVLGYEYPVKSWALLAFIGSGLIFPIALLLSKLLGVNFMSEKSAVDDAIGPAFIGMLLFWPMAFAAYWTAVELTPLILAIGMAMHWPIIGWTYGRPGIYSAHAIVRALAAFAIWLMFPEQRTTWVPASVAIVYLLTVVAILSDVKRVAATLKTA